jgi:peptidyl-prolyl cis-trans isomerase D
MLSSMRTSKKNQPFVYGLMGLLALGLVGVASGGVGGARVNSIGSVGEEPIPVTSYAQSLRNTVQNISRQIGRQVTAQEVVNYGLQAEALENVASSAALSNEASRLGLSVGDALVAKAIVAAPAFSSIDGKFDKEAYKFALERSGLNTKEYELQTRKAIARGLIEGAISSGAKTPNSHALTLIKHAREERSFEWANIDTASLTMRATNPNELQLTTYYNDNPKSYTTLLTRKITYVMLSPEMLAGAVNIPEGSIEEDYDNQPDRFNKPARRTVDRIIFETINLAEVAKNQIAEKVTTFEQLVISRGLTIEDIDLGNIQQGQLSSNVDKLLFESKETGIYGPVETDLGPALFRINAVTLAQNTKYSDAREELTAEFVGEESRRLIGEMVTDIDDLLAQGLTLEEIAKETDMTLKTISINANSEEGIAAYDDFRIEAFSAIKGGYPELRELSDGGIFALRLDKLIQPSLRPFKDVRQKVAQDWAVSEDEKSLVALVADITKKLDNGASFETLELKVFKVKSVARNAYIDGVPITLIKDVFASGIDKTNHAKAGNSIVIARLNKIIPFDETSDIGKNLLSQVRLQLSNQVTGDLLRLFASALKIRDGVSLNQVAVNQINTQILGGSGF